MEKNITKERLDILLDATLLQYCENINLVDITSVCDAMLKHLVEGDLDREFLSPKLTSVSSKEKEKAFTLARKYSYLCFYEGNVDYWEDSVDGYNPGILSELIVERILDNYNFLVELAYEKGESAVAELINFKDTDFSISSIVDTARNVFDNDQILKSVLANVADTYSDLNSKDKAILYNYPEGVLYTEYDVNDTKDFILIPREELQRKVSEYTLDNNITALNEVIDYYGDSIFQNIIRDIHLESLNDKGKANYK